MGEIKEIDFEKLQKALEAKITEQEELEQDEIENQESNGNWEGKEDREAKGRQNVKGNQEPVSAGMSEVEDSGQEAEGEKESLKTGRRSDDDEAGSVIEKTGATLTQKPEKREHETKIETEKIAETEIQNKKEAIEESVSDTRKGLGHRIRSEIQKMVGEDPEEIDSKPKKSAEDGEPEVNVEGGIDYSKEYKKQMNFARRFLGEVDHDFEEDASDTDSMTDSASDSAVKSETDPEVETDGEAEEQDRKMAAAVKALSAATIFVEGENRRDEKFLEEEDEGPSMSERTQAVISNLNEYKKKLWAYRKKKWVRLGAVVLGVLLLLFIATQVVKYWTFDSYSRQTELTGEDTAAASYSKVGDKVLRFSLDGAVLYDEGGDTLWTSSYTMYAPAVDSCGDTMVIYDTQGTSMYVYQEKGEVGKISTDMPIIKAKVAKQGVVAAILESGENTWIQYYDKDGSSIASFKTTLDSPGYPLDLALSEDGLLMAVSYLQINQGMPETKIEFYNWSSIGQNQMDNMVNSYTLKDSIAPQAEYLDSSTCIVFRDDGFTVYEGPQIPKELASIDEEKEIVSTFHNKSYVGYVVHSDDADKSFTMKVYNLKGREVFQEDFDFDYDYITMDDNQVLMYNSNQMCTYSLAGVKKFEGDIKEGMLSNVLPFGSNRYLLVTEGGTCTIKLK